MGSVYNFCTPHQSLCLVVYLPNNRRRWVETMSAMAVGITEHVWTMEQLLCYQVPPPPWTPLDDGEDLLPKSRHLFNAIFYDHT